MSDVRFYSVLEGDSERLDSYLAEQLGDVSRSYIQRLIEDNFVLVNGKKQKKSFLLKEYDEVRIEFPQPRNLDILPEEIPLNIFYEDSDIIVVNKEKGMVVHPAPGNYEHTLVNALLFHCKGNLSQINGTVRPGIVHRIDKDTSGLLVIAKNNNAHQRLSGQFKEHSITRTYHMLCFGMVKEDRITVDKPIGRNPKNRLQMAIVPGGKRAVTHFSVLERFSNITYMQAELETGRTHQIRVHSSYLGHPLLGDSVYTNRKTVYSLNGQTLHAKTLGFLHPVTREYMEFDSSLPDYFNRILNRERQT